MARTIPQLELAPPQESEYRYGAVDQLREDLTDRDASTVMEPIGQFSDIELTETGRRKADGYRLTPLALSQLCQCVSPGLHQLTLDISGTKRRRETFDEVVDPVLAVRIVNSCGKLRFRIKDGLMGRLMVLDNRTKTVEGILGPGYKYLSNADLFSAVDEMMVGADPAGQFYSAHLLGRRLTVVFRLPRPLFTMGDRDFYGGYYFGNSEAGEIGVQTAQLITVIHGGSVRCLGPLQHIKHAGKGFTKRLARLLNETLAKGNDSGAMDTAAKRLIASSMGMDVHGQPRAERQRIMCDALRAGGVDMDSAMAVLDWATHAGQGSALPSSTTSTLLATRSHYDVFIQLMRHAVSASSLHKREQLERAAYDLLIGKLNI
jgi:hypothetical protein